MNAKQPRVTGRVRHLHSGHIYVIEMRTVSISVHRLHCRRRVEVPLDGIVELMKQADERHRIALRDAEKERIRKARDEGQYFFPFTHAAVTATTQAI